MFCNTIVSTGNKWSTWDRLLLSPWLPLCWQSTQERLGSLAGDLTRNQTGLEYLQGVCGWKLSRLVLQRRQNNFAHWSTQTFYLNAIKIYLLLACKVNQNGVLLVSLLIVYMSHIEYIHWTWFDQEALGANVALEDINRTALVRLKQVGFNLIFYFFHKVIIRAWKNLARASHTKFPPRTQRRTLRTAAWVLLTGLRCRNDQYFCTNGHSWDGTLLTCFAEFLKFRKSSITNVQNHTYRKRVGPISYTFSEIVNLSHVLQIHFYILSGNLSLLGTEAADVLDLHLQYFLSRHFADHLSTFEYDSSSFVNLVYEKDNDFRCWNWGGTENWVMIGQFYERILV